MHPSESLTTAFLSLTQITLIDVLLGGDNAVVIALACRQLPPRLRFRGIALGTLAAIVMRIALMFFALSLLNSLI